VGHIVCGALERRVLSLPGEPCQHSAALGETSWKRS
jgi:hypothetical protein